MVNAHQQLAMQVRGHSLNSLAVSMAKLASALTSQTGVVSDVLEEMAGHAAKLAKARYMMYARSIHPLTKATHDLGKAVGNERARPPWPISEPPLRRLAAAVKVKRRNARTYEVGVDNGKAHPVYRKRRGGHTGTTPVKLLAHWIENPKPFVIWPVSPSMVTYLRAMRAGKPGYGRIATANERAAQDKSEHTTLMAMVIKQPQWYVWREMGNEMLKVYGIIQKALYGKISVFIRPSIIP